MLPRAEIQAEIKTREDLLLARAGRASNAPRILLSGALPAPNSSGRGLLACGRSPRSLSHPAPNLLLAIKGAGESRSSPSLRCKDQKLEHHQLQSHQSDPRATHLRAVPSQRCCPRPGHSRQLWHRLCLTAAPRTCCWFPALQEKLPSAKGGISCDTAQEQGTPSSCAQYETGQGTTPNPTDSARQTDFIIFPQHLSSDFKFKSLASPTS